MYFIFFCLSPLQPPSPSFNLSISTSPSLHMSPIPPPPLSPYHPSPRQSLSRIHPSLCLWWWDVEIWKQASWKTNESKGSCGVGGGGGWGGGGIETDSIRDFALLWRERARRAFVRRLPSSLSRSLSYSHSVSLSLALSLREHVCWCVRLSSLSALPSLLALLLFAAATDELGRGGKADVSGQRKTGGVWIGMQD